MKLMEVIKPEVMRSVLRRSRGKNIKKYVKYASKDANPSFKGMPFTPGPTVIPGAEEGRENFSGSF